ncbi:MAG: ATP-binding cassette domain-containing protein [Bacillota bacterium]
MRGERASGSIRLQDVAFAYPGKEENVIKGVSLSIGAGEKWALVGPSGSGKSTIVDLLFKLYDTGVGRIEVDGKDIREWDTAWLRSQMAIVTQDVMLRSGTLAENLRIGKREATDEELLKALEDSGLGKFMDTLQEGLQHRSRGEGKPSIRRAETAFIAG